MKALVFVTLMVAAVSATGFGDDYFAYEQPPPSYYQSAMPVSPMAPPPAYPMYQPYADQGIFAPPQQYQPMPQEEEQEEEGEEEQVEEEEGQQEEGEEEQVEEEGEEQAEEGQEEEQTEELEVSEPQFRQKKGPFRRLRRAARKAARAMARAGGAVGRGILKGAKAVGRGLSAAARLLWGKNHPGQRKPNSPVAPAPPAPAVKPNTPAPAPPAPAAGAPKPAAAPAKPAVLKAGGPANKKKYKWVTPKPVKKTLARGPSAKHPKAAGKKLAPLPAPLPKKKKLDCKKFPRLCIDAETPAEGETPGDRSPRAIFKKKMEVIKKALMMNNRGIAAEQKWITQVEKIMAGYSKKVKKVKEHIADERKAIKELLRQRRLLLNDKKQKELEAKLKMATTELMSLTDALKQVQKKESDLGKGKVTIAEKIKLLQNDLKQLKGNQKKDESKSLKKKL